jgi:serine protease inhibitor
MKSNIFKIAIAISITFSLLTFSCKKTQDEILPEKPVTIDLTDQQVTLIESENTFAFDIFKEVLKNESGNIIISPLSISFALSMTLNGANGATRDSMIKALRLNNITPAEINKSYKDLTEALLSVDKRVLISIANSVWTEKDFVVKKPFIDILSGYYNAESKSFDINDPAAPGKINQWIEDNTNGLIKEMIDKLNDNTVMLLINAIYFKGKWKYQFDEKTTVQRSFYKPDGSALQVPFMRQTSEFKIFQGDKFILAELPYGQGNFVMDVILPDDYNGIEDVLPLISDNSYRSWLNKFQTLKVNLSFPRFKYDYKKKLKDILSIMGMKLAFTDLADFSNISDLSLLINEVTHQAFIETNEEGTEAAAATVVDIGTTSIGPNDPFILNVDHSFLYFIRETTTNSIVFMGKVVDPLAD